MKNTYKLSAIILSLSCILAGCSDNKSESLYTDSIGQTSMTTTASQTTVTEITTTAAKPDKDDKPIAPGKDDNGDFLISDPVSMYQINAGGNNVDVIYSSSDGISLYDDYAVGSFALRTKTNGCYLETGGQMGDIVYSEAEKSFDTYTLDINGKNYGLVVYKKIKTDYTFIILYLIDSGTITRVARSDMLINGQYTISGDILTVSDTESYRINVENKRLEVIE